MKSKKLTCITAMIVFVALAIPFQLTAQQTRYTVTSLGTLGGNNSFAQGINNRGEVVGVAETPDTDPNCECPIIHAFLWSNGIHDLGTLGGRNSGAGMAGVNPEGQVVGFAETEIVDSNNPPFQESHAFLWQKGVMSDLGTLGGNDSTANAIDSQHRVVGDSLTGEADPFFGQQFHPYLWEKGVMRDLGTLGGSSGFAAGINEVGQVVGGTSVNSTPVPPFGGPPFFAFFWENGVMTNTQQISFEVFDGQQISQTTFVLDLGSKVLTIAAPKSLLCAVASERRRAKWKLTSESVGCGSAWKWLTSKTRTVCSN